MARTLKTLLANSALANVALLGVVGARFLRPDGPAGREARAERPASDVVRAAWAQLPEADRTALRAELREQWRTMAPDRERLGAAGRAVRDAALIEPFDETRLRNALIVFQQREQMVRMRAEDVLISHLGRMPPEARATAAEGLLTPANMRLERQGRGGRRSADRPPEASDVKPPERAD